jgi:GGDEF domain-containing protein
MSEGKFQRLLSRLFSRIGGNREMEHEPAPRVLDCAAFHDALHRERSRADRTGGPMSVLVVQRTENNSVRGGDGADGAMLREAARILSLRVRCTDFVGWLGDDKLGVILPHTPRESAQPLVDHVRLKLQQRFDGQDEVHDIELLVCAYPQDGAPGSRNDAMPTYSNAAWSEDDAGARRH